MADASAEASSVDLDGSGGGDMKPPGVLWALSEKMKSSRFMGSEPPARFSDVFRNWAMPLGAF